MPRLTLIGNYTRNIDKPVIFLPESFGMGGATEIGADNNFNAYLDLSVPLYSRYNVSARNYAQENFHLRREQLRQAQQTVTNDVKKAYFACLLSSEIVRVRERALANAEDNHALIVQKLAQGVATEYDETSARVRASVFRNDLLDARDRRVPAENTLKLLLGLSPEASLRLTDSLYLDEQELTFIPDASELIKNSALRQNEHRVQISQGEIDMARSAYYPVLSGTGTYQYQSQQNDFRFSQYQWVLSSAVGLRLQVPLFNGMITRNRVQQNIIREGIARIELNYRCGYNEARFDELVSRLGYLKERIAVQTDNIALAGKAVALVRERYHYGKASLLEVNSAELDLVVARLSYLQSIADYKSSYSDLLILTGNEKP
ncbi:TolC family protein [Dawidia soli]|uniref:TolC family protein n=1 Tax=Dawidia soli TaxID=2782352 RepID=A0AAP2DGM5_9BACT|nr:TolC family protein [Dawidia soli]MBT1690731.1 TolC family protein [Dawidia soli]